MDTNIKEISFSVKLCLVLMFKIALITIFLNMENLFTPPLISTEKN